MEDVADYPRPPRVEPCARRVRIEVAGRVIADSRRALRVLETFHPPTIYIPPGEVAAGVLRPARGCSVCEFKGRARYFDVLDRPAAAWSYAEPWSGYEALRDHLAFYPGRMDACFLDDERVLAQPGDFYGGWLTADIIGPVKGAPGTTHW